MPPASERARGPMIGDVIADRYELIELVGKGGMSSVYKAHDQLLERNVALKVLHAHYGDDAEYVERFRREARAVAQLSHPNIVTVIDRGEADGHQFIVFELIEGENLKELVNRTGPLPVRQAVELAIAIADGLAFAHEHGIVHRDVKPQNVLLNRDGEAKVTDFGIARSLDVEHGVTQTGTVLGTSSYLSPEQAGGQQVTPATDVYSLGVILYELLAGEVPFAGDNFVAVAMRQLNEPVPDILERRPDVPARLAAALEHALEKEPADRFTSMGAFATELRECLAELGSADTEQTMIVAAPPHRQGERPAARRPPRRWPVVALLALVLVAAIASGIVEFGRTRASTGTPPVAAGGPVTLHGITAYDPFGNNKVEHNAEAPNATDGNPATYWETEHYSSGLGKPGVGVVLDAGAPVALTTLKVTSDTPGFTALIETGASATGPFVADSPSRTVGASTVFPLNGHSGRYYLVWITDLGSNSSVHVNDVTASS
jgi:eukaryotic-like serine/threonine-protein kinase